MSTVRSGPFVSLEEFLVMEPEEGARLEWCAGIVYAMSGGSPEHGRLTARIAVVLSSIGGDECAVFGSNTDIWVDATQFYGQADGSLVCGALQTHLVKKGEKTLGEAITNPVVIVEVLSPSTEARDRGEKFGFYKQSQALQEYVLISRGERRVEVRRRTSGGWSIEVVTGAGSVKILGKTVTLDALYGAP